MTTGNATATTAPRGITRQDVFSVLGALGAIVTLVTAVMFYFGWERSDVQAHYMGIDVSLFGFSSQDYVLRSISALYLPLLVVIGLAASSIWLHARMVGLLASERLQSPVRREQLRVAASRLVRVALAAAAASVLLSLAAGFTSQPPLVDILVRALSHQQWVVPLVLLVSTLVAVYARWVERACRPDDDAAADPATSAGAVRPPFFQGILLSVLVAGVLALTLFWLLGEYAAAVGRGYAEQISRGVDQLSRAVVISDTPLGLHAPGVTEDRLAPTGGGTSGARYRTSGLRLLARSGGKVLLVHDGWTPRTGTVIVIADSSDLTWEFSR